MLFLWNLSGTLTVLFLVLLALQKYSGVTPALEGPFRVGLVAAGIAWAWLTVRETTGTVLPAALYPVIVTLVLLGPKLLRKVWNSVEDRNIRRRRNWRCPSCGKENEEIARVCYYCQAWRKTA